MVSSIVILVLAFSNFGPSHGGDNMLSYSNFLSKVEAGQIAGVNIQGQEIRAMGTNDQAYETCCQCKIVTCWAVDPKESECGW